MGYRGKLEEQNRARELRAQGWTYAEIDAEVGVSKSSVWLWCRDVEPDEASWAARARANRNYGARNLDEWRLRVHLYLHQGLDLDAAMEFWSELTGIPPSQFTKPYRAAPDPTIRRAKHTMGCPKIRYGSAEVLRKVLGLTEPLLHSPVPDPG